MILKFLYAHFLRRMHQDDVSRAALLGKRQGLRDRSDDCGSGRDLAIPAPHVRELVQRGTDCLMAPNPSEMGDVCDAVFVAGDVLVMFEDVVEHAERPVDLRKRALLGFRLR